MTNDKPKTIAILSYITIIGWIVAFIMNMDKKTALGSFHIRQTLLLYIIFAIGSIIPIIGWILQVFAIVLLIIGLFDAIHKRQKPVVLVGKLAQDWFSGL